jgi:hypothetical protein
MKDESPTLQRGSLVKRAMDEENEKPMSEVGAKPKKRARVAFA